MRLFGSRSAVEASPRSETAAAVRLLLVDDDEDDFRLMRKAVRDIQTTHYELEWISDYQTAVRAMTSNEFDAYLVDYRLGPNSGLDLVREARAGGCEAPLIMLTGEGSTAVDMAAMDAGATDYLEKGRTANVLLDRTLRYAISHAEMTAALRRNLRQVSGLEALGRLLSERGPTPDALDGVMRLLAVDFGLPHASLYLMDQGMLELAAVHGYEAPATSIDPRSGRLTWIIQSSRPQLIPNLTVDPSSRTGNEPLELCVPLIAEAECVGILNVVFPVGSPTEELDRGVRVVADRLAVALALNRAIRGRSFVAHTQPPAAEHSEVGTAS